jgi:hypothetical protein
MVQLLVLWGLSLGLYKASGFGPWTETILRFFICQLSSPILIKGPGFEFVRSAVLVDDDRNLPALFHHLCMQSALLIELGVGQRV